MTQLIPLEGATPTSLTLPVSLSYDEWRQTTLVVAGIGKASPWWIGDALVHGEAHFGEQYAQAASETDYSPESLRAFQWVSSRIPPDVRRITLSWGHHQAVAATDDPKVWLEKAESEKLSVKQLREAIRGPKEPKAVCGYEHCPMRDT